jgi:hypothetical protein
MATISVATKRFSRAWGNVKSVIGKMTAWPLRGLLDQVDVAAAS